jgi:NADH-quinone oxidoreductase subunit I
MKKTMRRLNFWQQLYIPEILRGMLVTTRHFWFNLLGRKLTVTQQYPEQPTYVTERYRGRHRLMRKENGSPRCTACMLCATSCPALCIHIQGAEHEDPTVEKYPISFMIDELRCVFCGLCVEACPCDAIRMDTGIFALAAYEREHFLYPRNLLLGDDEPTHIAEGRAPAE